MPCPRGPRWARTTSMAAMPTCRRAMTGNFDLPIFLGQDGKVAEGAGSACSCCATDSW